MEWKLAKQKPKNYQIKQSDDMLFCDNERYYIGRLNFDGKWFDYETKEFKENIEAWAYLPSEPITLGNAQVISDWNIGSGPVIEKFKHFLFYDKAVGEVVYKHIDSNYFDSKRRTFPEISHWIALPNLPLHYRELWIVQQIKASFLHLIARKLGIENINLEPFNEECLSQSIGELVNTTINGISEIDALSEVQIPIELFNRWTNMVNLWFNNTGNTNVSFTFGTTAVPESFSERKKIRSTLLSIEKALQL